jgi:ribosome maturation factor RimP
VVDRQAIEDRVAPLAERVAEREGCELVHVEYVNQSGRWILRLFIDRPDGVHIDDCAAVSRQMSAMLDVEDFIPHAYHLEVSSPGLDRPLRKGDDYRRFAGEPVSIRTSSPIGGRRRFRGILEKFENEVVTVTDESGTSFEIPLEKVSKARLDPRI